MRAVAEADLFWVADIYRHYVQTSAVTFDLEPPSVADWAARAADLGQRGLPFFVAVQEDRVLGFAYAAPWRTRPAYRHTAEDTVYIDADATGHGIGRRLLAAVVDGAAAADVHELLAVIADTGDPASTRLHAAAGFAEAGRLRRVGRKHGRWWDTVLMQRSLR